VADHALLLLLGLPCTLLVTVRLLALQLVLLWLVAAHDLCT
jgi:hypothetical protein